jgi:hypothetical protein
MTSAGDRVGIPLSLEGTAVVVYHVEKETMKKPQMCRIGAVEAVEGLKPIEESSPASCKLRPDFDPKTLYPGFMCGPERCEYLV